MTEEPRRMQEYKKGCYLLGFILSLILTGMAYALVAVHQASDHQIFSHQTLTLAVAALAVVQFFVQARYFLHVGDEARPRWNLVAFIFAIVAVAVVVGGSLWIMNSLNYQMNPSPSQMNSYMLQQENMAR